MFKKLTVIITVLLISAYSFAGSQQVSSTTAATIILNARAYLNDESSAPFWDGTELLQWLNDGMVDLVGRSHCLETTENINLVADQVEYPITSSYILVKWVRYVDSDSKKHGLLPGNPFDAGSVEDVEEPAYWYDWAGKIGVYPVLSSVTTELVTVYLVTRPAAITPTDAITVPAIYDKALTMYVVAQAWAKDRQMGKYAQAMGLYQAELDRYRKDFLSVPKEPAR